MRLLHSSCPSFWSVLCGTRRPLRGSMNQSQNLLMKILQHKVCFCSQLLPKGRYAGRAPKGFSHMRHSPERDNDHIPFAPAALKLSQLLVCALWHKTATSWQYESVSKSSDEDPSAQSLFCSQLLPVLPLLLCKINAQSTGQEKSDKTEMRAFARSSRLWTNTKASNFLQIIFQCFSSDSTDLSRQPK